MAAIEGRLTCCDAQPTRLACSHPVCQRLMTIPGLGELTATALVAPVSDAASLNNGHQFASWLELVPRQHSTGASRTCWGSISAATCICPPCWCTGPGAVCGGWIGSATTAAANGRAHCWNGRVGIVQPGRSPIRTHVWHRSCRGRIKSIVRRKSEAPDALRTLKPA
jgi:Transposase IS116/IS110/IS902 family